MEYAIVGLGTLVLIQFLVILVMIDKARKRVSMNDLADKAAELSAKTHISFDTAMQSLLGVYNAYGKRLKK